LIPGKDKRYSFLRSAHTGSGAHPASYLMCTGDYFPEGKATRGMKLTTHLQLVSRLRMRMAIPSPYHITNALKPQFVSVATNCFN
jgi:hypothetical protein